MKVYINEKDQTVTTSMQLDQLLELQGYVEQNFAVAVNKTFVPRQHYATTIIKENDKIDIVHPMQGG